MQAVGEVVVNPFLLPTRFRFNGDLRELKTYYSPRNSDEQYRSIYYIGVISLKYRIVEKQDAHADERTRLTSGCSSPLKREKVKDNVTVAFAVQWQWKAGDLRKSCEFFVPAEKKLDKSAYEKARIHSGDKGQTISFFRKDFDGSIKR
ncbi:uncharacterized protein LOC129593034 [Paramacrobiotus metropolitanus]|uniref:uncharacterized protein LOC129593034 n=1 Tax=Paramacrobiotus metropolitanus TaxID=2943436 RepID=UPI00244583C1|nr:uncharacterized protein LOC129593034 [Paramacrobiotus metropolitanus]